MTQTKKAADTAKGTLSHRQVREYLRANPDFFTQKDTLELLAGLHVPHKTAGSISLLEYQIKTYRRLNNKLAEQLEHLMMVHEANERARGGFVAVLDALCRATSLKAILQKLPDWWMTAFDNIEEVRLVCAAAPAARQLADISDTVALYPVRRPPQEIENALRSQRHEFGQKMSNALAGMFTTIEARSFLLLSDSRKGRGAILLGSTSAKRFSRHLSADFALSIARATIGRIWDMYAIETFAQTAAPAQAKRTGAKKTAVASRSARLTPVKKKPRATL